MKAPTWEVGVDTSTLWQSFALFRDGVCVESTRLKVRGHSKELAGICETTLARHGASVSELDRIIIGVGPGSFTGLRIGLAFVKGLAFADSIPLVAVESWRGIASALPENGLVASAFDARKSEVYCVFAQTGTNGQVVIPIGARTPRGFAESVLELRDAAKPLWLAGDGFATYDELGPLLQSGTRVPSGVDAPLAEGLVTYARAAGLVGVPAGAVEPTYHRLSEAEIKERERT